MEHLLELILLLDGVEDLVGVLTENLVRDVVQGGDQDRCEQASDHQAVKLNV